MKSSVKPVPPDLPYFTEIPEFCSELSFRSPKKFKEEGLRHARPIYEDWLSKCFKKEMKGTIHESSEMMEFLR